MRPGRLDRILYVGPPDQAGREEILAIKMRSMTVGPDLDIRGIAELVSDVFSIRITGLLILVATEPDGGLFWRRNSIPVPRGGYHHDAEGYELGICKFP
jgi:hypothetical protein